MKTWFPRGASKPKACKFEYEMVGEDLVLTLKQGTATIPVSAWSDFKPEAASAIAMLHFAADGAEDAEASSVQVDDNSVRLQAGWVAALDAANATALDLPPAVGLGLDLRSIGRIDEDRFCLQVRWVRPGGQPVRVELQGAILQTPEGPRRAVEPLWSLYGAASKLIAPLEKAPRLQALAELRHHWPEDAGAKVDSDVLLRDLRVYYASSLSLKLRSLTPDQTQFDPVLFGGRTVAEAVEEGRSLDEEFDNVLTPAAQKVFAEKRFGSEADARPVYLLREGEYVFIDPALRPALDVVRKLQDRPEAERREFILNPRRVLRERLGDHVADTIGLDALFVETDQFSSRVAGVDVWRAAVLPWLAPIAKNQWLPERFGLRVGEDYFVLPRENVRAVIDLVEAAAAAGQPVAQLGALLRPVDNDGPTPPDRLPVNEQTLEAVRSFAPFAVEPDGVGDAGPDAPAAWDATTQGKLFLVVRENFDNVEYAPVGVAQDVAIASGEVKVPGRLRATLKPHQLLGLSWLANSARAMRPGALLADDMGLGKTLQAIAFMAWLQDEAEAGRRPAAPCLIVAPTGLLGTWRDEILNHLDFPRLGPMVPAFGPDLKSLREEDSFGARDIETGRASLKAESWREAGVVLTTYETLRDYHFSFARTKFGLIVYDEIQKLKNPTSQMTRAAKALNGSFTLGMTGTPVENRLQDLWSIMDVIAPGLLGASRDFERSHPSDDISALRKLKSRLTEGQDSGPAYMLRRMKSDALEDMPQKLIHAETVTMPPVQARAYRELVVRAAAASSAGNTGKGGMLKILAELRGVSLHPLDPRQAPSDLDLYARDSARLSHTLTVLDEVAAKGEKALIFVESLGMQERLAGLIQARYSLAKPPMRINGTVAGPKRQAMVTAFQKNRDRFDVMILSPKAGGVGLTLTSANHVIHLSRWWNPAVEDQATDRVFRIGQTKDVHVYIPMAVHPDPAIHDVSFDLRLNDLISRKRQLTRDLFLPSEANDADLADLFNEVSLGAVTEPAPQDGRSQPRVAPEAGKPVDAPAALPAALSNAGVRRWRCAPNAERPTRAILDLFAGMDIAQVTIRDPYCIARANGRQAQVQFLLELQQTARRLEQIVIEYAPEAEGDMAESRARADIGEKFSRAFRSDAPRLCLTRRNKRSVDDDFHDRFVEIDERQQDNVLRRHEISIGRGVEALYDNNKECTATYAPPI